MIYLTNAFSLNMLPGLLPREERDLLGHPARVEIIPMSALGAKEALEFRSTREGWVSAVGHASTAAVFESELGLPVPCQRTTVALAPGDALVVGQYSGPRLEEGATTLPAGASIRWYWIKVRQYDTWQEWEDASAFCEGLSAPKSEPQQLDPNTEATHLLNKFKELATWSRRPFTCSRS